MAAGASAALFAALLWVGAHGHGGGGGEGADDTASGYDLEALNRSLYYNATAPEVAAGPDGACLALAAAGLFVAVVGLRCWEERRRGLVMPWAEGAWAFSEGTGCFADDDPAAGEGGEEEEVEEADDDPVECLHVDTSADDDRGGAVHPPAPGGTSTRHRAFTASDAIGASGPSFAGTPCRPTAGAGGGTPAAFTTPECEPLLPDTPRGGGAAAAAAADLDSLIDSMLHAAAPRRPHLDYQSPAMPAAAAEPGVMSTSASASIDRSL